MRAVVQRTQLLHMSPPPTVAYEMNVKDYSLDYSIELGRDYSIELNQVSFEEEPPPQVVEEQVECGFRPMPYGQTGWPQCS